MKSIEDQIGTEIVKAQASVYRDFYQDQSTRDSLLKGRIPALRKFGLISAPSTLSALSVIGDFSFPLRETAANLTISNLPLLSAFLNQAADGSQAIMGTLQFMKMTEGNSDPDTVLKTLLNQMGVEKSSNTLALYHDFTKDIQSQLACGVADEDLIDLLASQAKIYRQPGIPTGISVGVDTAIDLYQHTYPYANQFVSNDLRRLFST
jgi:hypothetical protein